MITEKFNKRKKKLYITTTIAPTLYFFSGQPRLWKDKFDVCAIAGDIDCLKDFSTMEGIRYKHIPMHREISLLSDFLCLLRFIWLFAKERPYMVHGNTPKASMLSMLAAWLTCRPIRIYMCHGLRYQGTQGVLRKLLMFMERLSCACATHVLCVSKGLANTMIQDGLSKEIKTQVVGYGSAGGVDLEKYNPQSVSENIREKLGISADAFVFCFIGRVVKDKGVNELVGAFEKLSSFNKNVHLLIVGPYETNQNPIDETVSDIILNNSHIYAVGRKTDVRTYLKASDCVVLPSYREGFGMVLIEAGAMGLPCITTNITGCNEIIVSGENGIIIEPRDQEELYLVMKKWIENPSEIKKMADNARRMVEERFECHEVWNRYWKFYKSL